MLAVGPKREFTWRYADPNHPASSGSFISLVTGGPINPPPRSRGGGFGDGLWGGLAEAEASETALAEVEEALAKEAHMVEKGRMVGEGWVEDRAEWDAEEEEKDWAGAKRLEACRRLEGQWPQESAEEGERGHQQFSTS